MGQEQHDRRVDYVEFAVPDIAPSKKFYQAVFGWEFTDYGPQYTSFNDGRLSGGFRSDLEPSTGGPLVVLYSTDLDGIQRKIQESGGTIVKEPFEFPGGRRLHFKDPGGNELGVWSEK